MSTQPSLMSKPIGTYGFGLMGLTWRANPCPQSQAFETMRKALELGANFWNGGEFYGPTERNSLVLLNEYFQKYPEDQDKIVLSVKGGLKPNSLHPDGSEANVRRSVEDSLRQLQANGVTKTIDIFECARVDPEVPIEDTVSYLAKLVEQGKIGGIGLSEVSANTIRRAAKVHPIAAVEVELSLWATDIFTNGVAAACGELDIPIVAYSPLGRGALTGQGIKSNSEIPDDDFRKHLPKFQDDVLQINNKLVREVEKLADRRSLTKPQIALAWVQAFTHSEIPKSLSKEETTTTTTTKKLPLVVPIPGATTVERVVENIRPDIKLDSQEMDELNELVAKFPVVGARYGGPGAAFVEG